jgi:hypothetical protein
MLEGMNVGWIEDEEKKKFKQRSGFVYFCHISSLF